MVVCGGVRRTLRSPGCYGIGFSGTAKMLDVYSVPLLLKADF